MSEMVQHYPFFERKEDGRLYFKRLEADVFLYELFEICKTEKELMYVLNNITETLVFSAQEYATEELSDEVECPDDIFPDCF